MRAYAAAARWVLIGTGILFVVSGLVVTSLNWGGVIPAAYNWQGPVFLVLGLVGLITASLGLRSPRICPIVVLGLAYLPWTVIGLIGDTRRGYWPLVGGEVLGLVLVVAALIVLLRMNDRSHP